MTAVALLSGTRPAAGVFPSGLLVLHSARRCRRGYLKWQMPEPTILLVEDEPLVMLVAQDALEAGGFVVLPAQLSSEALKILESRSADLAGLVTDIRLPGDSNGWDIARRARELRADLSVVYTTGDSAADWPAQGVPNSVVVQKPYAGAQLLTAISTLITAADTHGAN